ncbi:ABC transporter ATP-binding protein/permease [Parvibaculum sp.]|jgi:ATP-binding cassette subfamily B protein|uniref:ABCB family ABC transporter ATP-binding protein/permease n=1 Tax=Parvibaculum sp. TaxID=2024848 RepID=UPI0025CF72AF|nr:ABC transporter ATP-binding protein/permease [Parvibaculum sp.]|tara:strand:- start:984 stop:2822 length:1839 start_codon:yes stop_codon:yes gene_type:complete
MLPRLWPEGRADLRARVVFALLALVAAKGVTVYVPFLYKYAVDALSPETVAAAALVVPVMLIVGYGVGRILMIALAQLRDAIFAKVGQNAVRELAVETFRHLHALSLRFHLERRTGGLSRVIERGTKGIDFLLRFSLFNIVPTIIELVLVCVILAYAFDIWYSVVTAVTVIVYMVFTFAVTEWRTRFRREMNDLDTEANTKAVDSLLNYETVKYFGNEEHETRRFDRSMTGYERAAIRTATSLSLLNTGQTLIFSTGLTLLMLMAANGIAQGALTVGSFVMINTYLIQLYQPLNLLGTVYREIRQALIDMETMFDLLQVPAEIKDKPGAPALEVSGGEIVFDDVKFYYDSDRRILDGVSFHVPAGGTLAIVGPSGAGKSTIGRILFRFYDISEGAVRIDGQDIRDVRQDSLRAVIGMVPQDTVLFNDTIRYNIRYGRPDATDEEVREAAELAQIGRFIESLPQGYETRVGERGLKLSGGEKQRVAIARTILKNPPILLLDEATSALDTHTEKEIQTALKGISRNRTTLVIAHRLSTVVDADEILVLDAGRVIERGRHEDLLSRGGAYAAMWNRQRESEEAELEEERLFAASKEAEEPQEKERTPVSADSGFA